jgi:hypothetical protein
MNVEPSKADFQHRTSNIDEPVKSQISPPLVASSS